MRGTKAGGLVDADSVNGFGDGRGEAVVGRLDDGTPHFAPLGELPYDRDEDRVRCHLCGGWFRFIGGTHLSRTHGWTLEEYREAFRLRTTTPTCSHALSETRRVQTVRRIAAGELPEIGRFADPAAGARARSSRRVQRWRSLAANHPELVAEIHPTRNGELHLEAVAANSRRSLWWRCAEGHEWHARVSDRARGKSCPVCANRRRGRRLGEQNQRVSPDRTLAAKHPDLLAELHPTRNQDIDLESLAAGSGRKVWWRCARGHEWRATPANRTAGTRCPKCTAQDRGRVLRDRGSSVPFERSLAGRRPDLVGELHPTRNGDIDPAGLGAGSMRKLWWRCPSGHEWEAAPNTRTRGSGCPICARQRPAPPERSLAIKHPELLAQLHPTRNGDLHPLAVAAGSNRKLWWRCAQGHEWRASVAARCRGTGCPVCARSRVPLERSLAHNDPELAQELHPVRNVDVDPRMLGAWSNRTVWWRCERGHEWQAVVARRSGGAGCPTCHQPRRVGKATPNAPSG